jgi:hypothetical protein
MNSDGEEFGMERVLELMNHADSSTHLNGNSKLAVAAPVGSTSVGSTSTGSTPVEKTKGKKAEEKSQVRLTGSSPCAPEASENEPEDLKIIERAVAAHVGAAPQSDDLTIVYLSAK